MRMDTNHETHPASPPRQTLTESPEENRDVKSHRVSTPVTIALSHEHETSAEGTSTTKHSSDTEIAQSKAKGTNEISSGTAQASESAQATDHAAESTAGANPRPSHTSGREASDTQEQTQVSEEGENPDTNYHAAPDAEATAAADTSSELGRAHTNVRPESLIVSPLTHPNGVDMFPSLSTTEQEQMSWEALTQAEESIVAEDESRGFRDDASDGGYESEGFSSGSTSAESSVRDYMFENGRRYHRFREGAYNFPNDDVEQEREDMKHAMVKLLCGQKLFFAPIGDNPQQILDIGTGTGIWVIESESISAHRMQCSQLTLNTLPSGRSVSQCQCSWHRPLPHSTRLAPAQRQIHCRRRRVSLAIPSQSLRLHSFQTHCHGVKRLDATLSSSIGVRVRHE